LKQIFKKAIIVKSPFKIGQLVTYDDLNEALEKNPDLVKFPVVEPTVKKTKKESVKVIHSVGNIKYVGSQIINEALKTISIFYIIFNYLKFLMLKSKKRFGRNLIIQIK